MYVILDVIVGLDGPLVREPVRAGVVASVQDDLVAAQVTTDLDQLGSLSSNPADLAESFLGLR